MGIRMTAAPTEVPEAALGPRGYSLPLSPSGESSMLTPPPWHFAGHILMVEYQVDPAAAIAFLPPELSLGSDPMVAAVFAEWQWCSKDGLELADPQRCQFNEFMVLIRCEFEGTVLARCAYAWVDRAVPMVRGWLQGMPKQFGSIQQTRPMPVGRAGGRLAKGGRFDGAVSVYGRRILEGSVTLQERVDAPPLLHKVPLVHTRLFPPWVDGEKPVSQLVVSDVEGVEFSDIWAGQASVRLFDDLGPGLADLYALAPTEVGRGYLFSYAETLCGGRLLNTTDLRLTGPQ
jgi:enduracididine biosynthesis enzyme MppR